MVQEDLLTQLSPVQYRQVLIINELCRIAIPDKYDYVGPELIELFQEKVPPFLESLGTQEVAAGQIGEVLRGDGFESRRDFVHRAFVPMKNTSRKTLAKNVTLVRKGLYFGKLVGIEGLLLKQQFCTSLQGPSVFLQDGKCFFSCRSGEFSDRTVDFSGGLFTVVPGDRSARSFH